MAKSEMQFGTIKITIEDEKSDPTTITNLCYNALTQLLPEAKAIAKAEREEIAKNMKLLKGKAECDACLDDNCECGEDDSNCPHHKNDLEIKNLYV